ncbi:hypothetical protein [Methylobacterium fujisawaense]|uniref:hypothetical protein n=1 Tax=Methylobacterium fujisawaense TaxID=107400 RepID=UPI002F3587B4
MRSTAKRRSVRAPDVQELVPPVPAAPPPSPEPERGPGIADAPEWRDPRTDPPFDLETERRQPHGPYEMLLRNGQIVEVRWGLHGTPSGGKAWGWMLRDQQTLNDGMIEGWRALAGR